MTSTAELETRINAAVRMIRVMWPALLVTLTTPRAGSLSSIPSPGSLYNLEPDDPRTDDLPRLDVAIAIRLEAEATLRRWSWFIVAQRGITETPPNYRDVPNMCNFITRHARWLTGLGEAPFCAAELEQQARQLRNLTFPPPRDGLRIGSCPNTIGVDGERVTCDTPIKVQAHHPGNIRCPGCGLTDTLDGWVLRIVGTEGPFTASQLIPILHRRLGIVVTETAIRQWVRRGVIEPAKAGFTVQTDEHGAYLYDARDVMARLVARNIAPGRRRTDASTQG